MNNCYNSKYQRVNTLGQITKVQGEQNTNASYQYDETGNITKITIKENQQQNIYNKAGRLIQNIQTIGKIKRQTTYSYTSGRRRRPPKQNNTR